VAWWRLLFHNTNLVYRMWLTSQPLQTANQGLWSQNKQTLLILKGTGAKPKQESYSFQKYIMWQRTIRRHHLPFHALIQLLVKLLCWGHATRMHPEPLQKSGYPTIHIPWTSLTCHNLLLIPQKVGSCRLVECDIRLQNSQTEVWVWRMKLWFQFEHIE